MKIQTCNTVLEYNNGVVRVVSAVGESNLTSVNPWVRPLATADNEQMRKFLLDNMNKNLKDAIVVSDGGRLIDFKPARKASNMMNQRNIDVMLDAFGDYDIKGEPGRNVQIIHHSGSKETFHVNGISLKTSSGKDFYSLSPELRWSPYSMDVHALAQIIRLACLNGMTTNDTSFMSKLFLPEVSSIRESAERATTWITSDVQAKMQQRLPELLNEYASIRELMVVYDMLSERISDNEKDLDASFRLMRLKELCDAKNNEKLRLAYKSDVFSDMKAADRVSSGVTLYDCLQILTEAASHTNGSDDHNMKLNRLAAKWLFEGGNLKQNQSVCVNHLVDDSPMTQAFYGI